ncbi:MAG: PQQ-binding-like beta-propeller repeat protein, partial [Planctomycetota bacterium]
MFLITWFLLAPQAAGQAFAVISGSSVGRLMPAPRIMRQGIRDAREAIQEGDTTAAVIALGDLLAREVGDPTDPDSGDFFINVAEFASEEATAERRNDGNAAPSVQLKSLRAFLHEQVGALPSDGLDTYQLQYGPIAAKTLQDAAASRDWAALEKVRRCYLHTEAGYQASYLLAKRHMHLGNPLRASLLLDDIVASPRAIKLVGDDLVTTHAAARRRAGRSLQLPERLPAAARRDVRDLSGWIRWVDRLYPWRAPGNGEGDEGEIARDTMDYPYEGGMLDRNGLDGGQMPLGSERWALETTASPRQEMWLDGFSTMMGNRGQLPLPSWSPVRVGDHLVMRTTERLLGVDYRTGKRIWQYPWRHSSTSMRRVDSTRSAEEAQSAAQQLIQQRVWNDVPYGQITSDGERVFMLGGMGRIELQRQMAFGMPSLRRSQTVTNSLVALDLATEGKLLWMLGGSEQSDGDVNLGGDPLLIEAVPDPFFLTAPMPVEGLLYTLVESSGEIVLLCLEPSTGALQWRQVLVSVESGSIASDAVRRVGGASLTHHQGVLICATGTGWTMALDLADRQIRWANHSKRNIQLASSMTHANHSFSQVYLSQRWTGPAVIADGLDLVLTPFESDRLVVADFLTGQ